MAEMVADKGQSDEAATQQSHGKADGFTMAAASQKSWSKERADTGSHGPSEIQPAIADGAGMQNAVTERSGDDALGEHASDEQAPAYAEQNGSRPVTKKGDTFTQLMKELSHGTGMDGGDQGLDHVASASHKKIAGEGENISEEVNEQHAAESDLVIEKLNEQRPR